MSTALHYPIGQYAPPAEITPEHLTAWIGQIEAFPATLQDLVNGRSAEVLNQPYRPGGWNVKQVVHHCADSHLQAVTRFKWALTEDQPTIKPYFEARWALLADAESDDLSPSLAILSGLHQRWAILLRSLSDEQWQRTFQHPEHGQYFTLAETAGNYAWHGEHHLAHVRLGLGMDR